jgi:homogentisate 1,2-dioxygenase
VSRSLSSPQLFKTHAYLLYFTFRQDPRHPLNSGSKNNEFFPFGAGLNGGMTTHGASEEEFQEASNAELKPTKVQSDGLSLFLLETENPLYVAGWAEDAAIKNFGKPKAAAKM